MKTDVLIVQDNFKVGDIVRDKWFLEWGEGKVVKVFKNSIHIKFSSYPKHITSPITIFDKKHYEFLIKNEKSKI